MRRRPLGAERLESRDNPAPMVTSAFPGVAEAHGIDPATAEDAFVQIDPGTVVQFITGDGADSVAYAQRYVGGKELPEVNANRDVLVLPIGVDDGLVRRLTSVHMADYTDALAVAVDRGGSAHISVFTFNPDLTVRATYNWMAAEDSWRDGATVSAVDVDRDGNSEVAVTFGEGAAPVLRCYRLDGTQVLSTFICPAGQEGDRSGLWHPASEAAGLGHIASNIDGRDVFLIQYGTDPLTTHEYVWATGEVRPVLAGPTPEAVEELVVGGPRVL